MNAVPFDTLRMAQRLETAGFPSPQAAGAAEALAEALIGADLATKSDLASLRAELKADQLALRAELKADNAATRSDLLSAIELLRRDMTIKMGGMVFVAVGVLLTAMRYMTAHP
jgi:hypothetical protein